MEQVKNLFHSGFEKLIFNTAIMEKPDLVKDVIKFAGSQSVMASIDVRKDVLRRESCWIEDGERKISTTAIQLSPYAERLEVGEILLTIINDEGSIKGYNIKLIEAVSKNVDILVIANGGAGRIEDLWEVLKVADAAAAGSIFVFYGRNKAVLINVPSEDDFDMDDNY